MKKLKSLSIFFPSLNDAQALPGLAEKAYSVAKKVSNNFEIIIINDGSTDNTKDVLNIMQRKYSFLKVINHHKNRGYGGALISGFNNSSKEWVFYTDGDGQYDPSELEKFVGKIDNKTEVINGYKIKRYDKKRRKFLGFLYNTIVHKIYDIPITDIDCDFRLIRNTCLQKIRLSSNSGLICLELILKLKKVGAQFKEVNVHHYPRQHGKSQFFSFKHLLKTFREHVVFFAHQQTSIS